MSDQPSTILRQAKGTHASIKEQLKTKPPSDKDIDFQRRTTLRSCYLNLLLVHPYAKESENAETHLWMQTSYVFISEYKQRLTRLDRANQQTTQESTSNNQLRIVEYRKLYQRFRQYLADEDKFWTQFVVRYYRSFDLIEAHDALVTLGILSKTADATDDVESNNGRDHFPFPITPVSPPTTLSERESRLTILSKALVCLGDIARYREQYNDDGGRKKNKRGGSFSNIPRRKNFDKARSCYEQAKHLTPHDGNPSHQLAIIASYEKDSYTSLVHYYRSLCVKHPYETASENMFGLLSRSLEQWKTGGPSHIPPDLVRVPKMQIEEFKRKVVVLHARWWLEDESHASLMIKEASHIANKFYELISERHLPEDFITQLILLAQGALWRIRMHQDPSTKSTSRVRLRSAPNSSFVEAQIFTHLLSLYRALFEVGIENLKEPPLGDSDLASRLIVEFRRTLPATRLAGKWLIANYKYVMSDPEAQGSLEEGNWRDTVPGVISPSSVETIGFWRKYAEFLRALSRVFPSDQLPRLTFALAEDIETRGFRPLKDFANFNRDGKATNDNTPRKENEVHPNDVQLMRIEDILCDAKALVQMESSPLAIYGNQFVLKGVESQFHPIPTTTIDPEDDIMTEVTSGTDDVLLRDAFGHLNKEGEDEDEDEDDQIVWDPKPSDAPLDPSPVLAQLVANVHLTSNPLVTSDIPNPPPRLPEKPSASPVVLPDLALSQDKPPRVDSTTAEDLLNSFMVPNIATTRPVSDHAVSQTPFLPSENNIWSNFRTEQSLRYSGGLPQMVPSLIPQARYHTLSASQDISAQQPIWQNSPLSNTLPSSPFAAYPAYSGVADVSHQRTLSASLNAALPPPPSRITQNHGSELSGSMIGTSPASYLRSQHPSPDSAENSYIHARHFSLNEPTTYSQSLHMPHLPSIWGPNG
ncbi:hypothetical protein FB446DRAFT_685913 [Lentinula raphanica]|nr:hypothetical protein FB446DRAFT_685913 [Lentinula raphanica]